MTELSEAIGERWQPAGSVQRRRVHVIINSRSGTPGKEAIAARVEEYFVSRGLPVSMELVRTADELVLASSRAANRDAEVVVAGGGDGTIATIASGLLDVPKLLAVLPLGTFNYFARRVGVPLDLEGALDVAARGVPVATAIGEVNGRVFLNNASIGLYPTVLKQRETTYQVMGRSQAAAYLSVAFALLQPPSLLNLEMTADGAPLDRRTPLLFVGINRQQLGAFGIPGEECLDTGALALYVTRPLTSVQLWRLAVRGFLRGLYGAGELEVVCARDVQVTLRRRRVRVAMDGEIAKLRTPLRFRLRRDALQVLTAPPAAEGS